MRKLNILLSIVLIIFTIVGCSGESDNNNGTESTIYLIEQLQGKKLRRITYPGTAINIRKVQLGGTVKPFTFYFSNSITENEIRYDRKSSESKSNLGACRVPNKNEGYKYTYLCIDKLSGSNRQVGAGFNFDIDENSTIKGTFTYKNLPSSSDLLESISNTLIGSSSYRTIGTLY